MAEQPSPKRQRLSESGTTRSQPTTPTRASYQSPTKASLARSHPNLLARSPGRDRNSGMGSRGKNLRMSLLANRTISLDGERGTAIPTLQSPKRGIDITPRAPATEASDGREGFSAAIARAFTEHRPKSSVSLRSPLTSRQPSASNVSHARSPSPVKGAIPAFMRPTLVARPDSVSSSSGHPSSEPDLPPTPVQLGLEPPAERPRGLISSSSSPRGSRSNSGKKRRRQRGSLLATSSPSKLREQLQRDGAGPVEQASMITHQLPAEAPESEIEQLDEENEEDAVPVDIKEKQATRRNLQTELAQLKADMRRLEAMVERQESNITPRTLKALTTTRATTREESPEIVLPEMIAMPANPIPHLTAFTPTGLRIKTSTRTTTAGGTFLQLHTIKVHAPVPYPPHLFGATIDVRSNPQTTQIESVALLKWHHRTTSHSAVRKWAEQRLRTPLHAKDVSGLIWGMGSYWEFCIKRATAWVNLTTGKLSDEPTTPDELVRWLDVESFDLPVRDGTSLLLSWTATLDWTSDAEESFSVACHGVPRNAHRTVADVFEGMRKRKGVVKAVEAVMQMLRHD